jgi:hypothetical protein
MYKRDNQVKLDEFIFPYGQLDKNNVWINKAALIPWDKIEEKYAALFVNNGHPAKGVRIALGSLIIKETLNLSDIMLVQQIKENPYLQYFLGMKEYTYSCPFVPSTLVDFRKRVNEEMLDEINEMIIAAEKKEEADSEDDDSTPSDGENNNKGTIIIDATCAPSDIRYPQDISILNEAREKTEKMVDELHEQAQDAKPRTDRNKARKEFLKLSRNKRKSRRQIRKFIRKHLGYIKRNLGAIDSYLKQGYRLNSKEAEQLETILRVYGQQKEMYDQKKHQIDNRIVSINQPYIRPIVRGKAHVNTEFGAKVEISLVEGFARIERLSWDAYNESESLVLIIEDYKGRTGHYPERILADKIYRNRSNLSYCKEKSIRLSGPALGRPKKDQLIDKKIEIQDSADRNAVEGKFGEGKRTYGLGLICSRLKDTAECQIRMIFIAMNLSHKLRVLLRKILKMIWKTKKEGSSANVLILTTC